MIEQLKELMPAILESIDNDDWDSLVINRRKPHTYRMFKNFGELRACLHVFDPCDPEDAFAHPHPWPGAFLILAGEYIHTVGYSLDLKSPPTFLYREVVRPFTMYEITHKQTWHTVQPTQRTYTVMINGPAWDGHSETRTTKGKDLEGLAKGAMDALKIDFKHLIGEYLKE
jgi:hypothetical protein